jgi:thiol-disulfide isomerase/thioredoxin
MKSSRMIVLGALVITTAVDAIAGGQVQVGKVSTRAPAVGDPAPPLVFDEVVWPKAGPPDLRSLDLSRLAGRVVVLEFFGTWCGPCLAFVPHMNEVIEQSADLPVTFLTIGNERRGELQATAAKYAMKSPIARDANFSIFEDYWVGGLPAVVLVDVKGRILAYTHPSQITRRTLEDVLAGRPVKFEGIPPTTTLRNWDFRSPSERGSEQSPSPSTAMTKSKPRTHRAFGRPN